MGDWDGKAAIVTGAGSGIGRATARLLAREGARVVAADVSGGSAEETVGLIRGEGGLAFAVQGDTTSEADVRRMVNQTYVTFGGVHLLHNNAAILRRHDNIEEVPIDEFRRVVDVNLTGLFIAAQMAVPFMKRQGGGVIVNTASMGALRPVPGALAYAAAKAGVLGLTRSMAKLLEPDGIRVYALCPSQVDTPLVRDPNTGELTNPSPMGLLQPEDIARAVTYVARCDAASGMSLSVQRGPTGAQLSWVKEHDLKPIGEER